MNLVMQKVKNKDIISAILFVFVVDIYHRGSWNSENMKMSSWIQESFWLNVDAKDVSFCKAHPKELVKASRKPNLGGWTNVLTTRNILNHVEDRNPLSLG